MNNLIISYDLDKPVRNYPKIIQAIKSLGTVEKIQLSLWYVKSRYNGSQAYDLVRGAIDTGDKICVVDATNNLMRWDDVLGNGANIIRLWG